MNATKGRKATIVRDEECPENVGVVVQVAEPWGRRGEGERFLGFDGNWWEANGSPEQVWWVRGPLVALMIKGGVKVHVHEAPIPDSHLQRVS